MARAVFLIQILLFFGGRCNRYFWDIRLKINRLPNFNMLFQLVLTKCFKSELFSLITDQLMQKAYPLANLDTSQNAITLNSPQLSIPWWPLMSALGFCYKLLPKMIFVFQCPQTFFKNLSWETRKSETILAIRQNVTQTFSTKRLKNNVQCRRSCWSGRSVRKTLPEKRKCKLVVTQFNNNLTSAHLKSLQISNQQNKTARKVLPEPGTYNKGGIFQEKMCEK